MKIPINKNPRCDNIEGLLQYERFFLNELHPSTEEDKIAIFEQRGAEMREIYCGSMCFHRYHCKIAEKYLK